MSFFYKIQVFDKKGAGAAICNFGSGSRRQFIFSSSAPAPQHCLLLFEGAFTSFFKDKKKSQRIYIKVEIKVFYYFAWWWKDPDPGDPKT